MCYNEIIEQTGGDESCFDKKTSASENKVSFHIEYPKGETFCRIHVDGCFVKDNESQKCDYVFVRCSNKETYYVELKGQDVPKAYNQIVETLKTHFPAPKNKTYGFIVASRVVPKQAQKIRKLKAEFAKSHGVVLKIGSQRYTHKI